VNGYVLLRLAALHKLLFKELLGARIESEGYPEVRATLDLLERFDTAALSPGFGLKGGLEEGDRRK